MKIIHNQLKIIENNGGVMLRVLLVGIVCIIIFILSIGYLIIYALLFFNRDLQNGFLTAVTRSWGYLMITLAGSKVEVIGKEKIPKEGSFLFIGNHQSHLDIPTLLGFAPKLIGFVAKKELMLIPFINIWILRIGGVYIERKNLRKAIETVDTRIKNLKTSDTSLVIFPEGHRSKGKPMSHFKPGSIKLAVREGINIIPFSIEGTYRMLEGYDKIGINRSDIRLTFNDPIITSELSEEEKNNIVSTLEATVNSGLSDKYKLYID